MADLEAGLFIALYTDEDVTTALAPALRARAYKAQSTAEAGRRQQSDEAQLEYATQNSMAILTANRRDFCISPENGRPVSANIMALL